jgi:hypothetical protein
MLLVDGSEPACNWDFYDLPGRVQKCYRLQCSKDRLVTLPSLLKLTVASFLKVN